MEPLGIHFPAAKASGPAERRKRKAIEHAAAKDKVGFCFL
jgi:hypothetical protein